MNALTRRFALRVSSFVLACASLSCVAHQQPSVEAANAVAVEKFVDPRTVYIHGAVKVAVTAPRSEWSRAEEYALDALKAEALREHPGTTMLFDVVLAPGSSTNSFIATGIAARARSD
jgi:hypothetical protein